MSRSLPQLQEEYNKLCAQAGHLQYTIASMSKDLESVNGSLRKLNEEAAALSASTNTESPADSAKEVVAEASNG